MTKNRLQQFIDEKGVIPLAWAGSTLEMNYLNFGDALSPVMVALCSGLGATRIPTKSKTPRLAAVGTIAHGFADGDVWFWGSGCSPHSNPSAKSEERIPYTPPKNTNITVTATRGPFSEALLTTKGPGVYGDPVWVLPRFYRPNIKKRWKVGAILHLSELKDRAYEAHPGEKIRRYDIPDGMKDDVHLINTVTPISVDAIRDRLDEIMACERIVSTSLHGMVLAETYGIPCLYFGVDRAKPGLATSPVSTDTGIDLRILDLYGGLRKKEFALYNQDRSRPTDWEALANAIDASWEPKTLDEDRLIGALPVTPNPVAVPDQGTVFDLPLLRGLQLQHDVRALRQADSQRSR